MREAKTFRNARIWQQFLEGDMTLKAIGSKHGISLERVRQIVVTEATRRGIKWWHADGKTSRIRELARESPGR